MSDKKLSEVLKDWRRERPDKYEMDEFIKGAEKLEAQYNELAAKVERLRKLIMDKTAQSVCCRASDIPFCCGDMTITWPDDVVAVLSETEPSALTSLKPE